MPYTLDKPVTEYSISQLLALYNDIARYNGTPVRNSTFRNKETAIKAVNGVLTQANSEIPVGEITSPGLARLRSSSLAEKLRASVLADQEAAAEVATNLHDATEVARDSRAGAPDTTVANPEVAKRGRTPSLTGNEVITLLVDKNPKRAGSASAARFDKYVNGQTVDMYGAAVRDRPKAIRDVQWDVKAGFIKLS